MVRRALLLAMLAVAPSVADARPWRAAMAPGDVSEKHAAAEDDCDRCHLPFKGIPDERCLDCHAEIAALIRAEAGFHGEVRGKACITCHTDHRGRKGALTKPDALAAFSHAKTRFPLRGAHEGVACEKCHDRPLEKLSAADACASCHRDPHAGELGADCRTCHRSEAAWTSDLLTKAQHVTSMEGGHTELGCKDCHARGANLVAKVSCGSCHEAQHGDIDAPCSGCHEVSGFAPAKHDHSFCTCKFPGIHETFDCLGCHAGWKFSGTPTLCSGCHAKIVKHEPLGECSLCHSPFSWKRRDHFDHNKRSKFAIEGEHLRVDCARCHTVRGQFRGAAKTCEGCHAQQGMAAHGDFGPCARCHTTEGFERPTFDHASTGFPLTGRHAKLECQDCHAEKVKGFPKKQAHLFDRPGPLFASLGGAFWAAAAEAPHGEAKACAHCHDDPHPGGARAPCESCHTTDVWRPSTFELTRHAATKLPLRGKHEAVACTKCHLSLQLTGIPADCSGCHFDAHDGKLGTACADCHSETGFKPVPGFDHARTGYPLIGAHGRVACASCHEGDRGETLARSAGTPDCATCHVPWHGKELGGDCARCHALEPDTPEHPATFARARGMPFPEHTQTGFALERRHRVLACASCHPAQGPAPTSRCGACHLDPHSGQLGQSCEDCHAADRFRLARFDHDRAGWPLRGKHFVTPCASCHTAQRWIGLTTDCFDCHALDAARARMRLPDQHAFAARDCRDCHASAWSWR